MADKNCKSVIEKLYLKYEYLAKKYSSQISSYELISFEREDLEQEFKIKIFTSIKSYGLRWGKYRRGEASKPVALKYYLETACANKKKDFMKYIEREVGKVSMDDVEYDFGYEQGCIISPETNEFIVNDIDVLEGLSGIERVIFSMFVRGYDNRTLARIISTKVNKNRNESLADVEKVIENQKNYLLDKYCDALTQSVKMYESYSFDD